MALYNSVSKVSDTHTLQEFMSFSNSTPDKFDYKSFCMIERRDGVEYPIHNVIDDYLDELKAAALSITLTSKEKDTYMYNPKLLSYKIYGTTLWYYVILRLNNICNVHDFNISKGKLLLIPSGKLKDILATIYNSNSSSINTYNTNHANDIKL